MVATHVRLGNRLRLHSDRVLSRLTPAELNVIECILQGYTTNQQLATVLGVSPRTIQTQIADICAKTGAGNKIEVVLMALEFIPCEIDIARQMGWLATQEEPRRKSCPRSNENSGCC